MHMAYDKSNRITNDLCIRSCNIYTYTHIYINDYIRTQSHLFFCMRKMAIAPIRKPFMTDPTESNAEIPVKCENIRPIEATPTPVCIHGCAYVHACMCTCMCIYTCLYVHMHVHIYI